MDDDLIEELLALYLRIHVDHDEINDDAVAELIVWHLRDDEVLDLAADALTDDPKAIAPTRELALHRIRELMTSFKKYHREDR